jgi:hypothetical protein
VAVAAAVPTTGLIPVLVVPVVAARAAVITRPHTLQQRGQLTQAAAVVAVLMHQLTERMVVLGL